MKSSSAFETTTGVTYFFFGMMSAGFEVKLAS